MDNLYDYDIQKISDVTINLIANYTENGESVSKTFGPYTAKSEYTDYEQSKIDEKTNVGTVVFDEKGIKITVLENRYETDSYATEQWLLIENYNDFVVNAGNDEVIVNGISVSNAIFLTNNIGPHLKAKAAVIIKLSESE